MPENMLRRVLYRLQRIEHKLNVENTRYVNVDVECKKNNVISLIFFILNILTIIINNIQIHMVNIFNMFVFVVMMILMIYSSRIWNFSVCPEKFKIKRLVHTQIVIRFIMIANLCVVLPFRQYFFVVAICLSVVDTILNMIINTKGRTIVMKNGVSIFKKDISNWEFNNIKNITASVTYGGVLLYVISVSLVAEISLSNILLMKVYMFIVSLYFISKKLSNAYENKKHI